MGGLNNISQFLSTIILRFNRNVKKFFSKVWYKFILWKKSIKFEKSLDKQSKIWYNRRGHSLRRSSALNL